MALTNVLGQEGFAGEAVRAVRTLQVFHGVVPGDVITVGSSEM
jgi:hypothetical protein